MKKNPKQMLYHDYCCFTLDEDKKQASAERKRKAKKAKDARLRRAAAAKKPATKGKRKVLAVFLCLSYHVPTHPQ
jgi:hypothetical protein